MLRKSETGYTINAEIYTGKTDAVDVNTDWGATGNVVCCLICESHVDQKHHIVYVDRFYSSCMLFYYIYNIMNTHAAGTVMQNRKVYPPSLVHNKKDLARDDIKYLSKNNLQALVWMDRKPIYFLSTFHNAQDVKTVNRCSKDGTQIEINIPALVVDYNSYMGGCNKNDQMTRLEKSGDITAGHVALLLNSLSGHVIMHILSCHIIHLIQ